MGLTPQQQAEAEAWGQQLLEELTQDMPPAPEAEENPAVAFVLASLTVEESERLPWFRVVGANGVVSSIKRGAVGRRQIERMRAEGIAVTPRNKVEDFRVIAWDAPGAGESSDPPDGFTLTDWADCLASFLDAVDVAEANLVGLSWGGLLAQEFYRLFLAPGVGHCGGGPGPSQFGQTGGTGDPEHDMVVALERWVEQGIAPTQIVATKFVAPDSSLRFRGLNHDPTVGLNGLSIRRHLRPRSLLEQTGHQPADKAGRIGRE